MQAEAIPVKLLVGAGFGSLGCSLPPVEPISLVAFVCKRKVSRI